MIMIRRTTLPSDMKTFRTTISINDLCVEYTLEHLIVRAYPHDTIDFKGLFQQVYLHGN